MKFTCSLFTKNIVEEELEVIQSEIGEDRFKNGEFSKASSLFSEMIKKEKFDEFLTLPAYELIN